MEILSLGGSDIHEEEESLLAAQYLSTETGSAAAAASSQHEPGVSLGEKGGEGGLGGRAHERPKGAKGAKEVAERQVTNAGERVDEADAGVKKAKLQLDAWEVRIAAVKKHLGIFYPYSGDLDFQNAFYQVTLEVQGLPENERTQKLQHLLEGEDGNGGMLKGLAEAEGKLEKAQAELEKREIHYRGLLNQPSEAAAQAGDLRDLDLRDPFHKFLIELAKAGRDDKNKVIMLADARMFGEPDEGSYLFQRDCYPKFLYHILGPMHNGTFIVATGTPGIGKSYFGAWVVWEFLNGILSIGSIVYHFKSNNPVLFIRKANGLRCEMKSIHGRDTYKTILKIEEHLVILDIEKRDDVPTVSRPSCKTILISSPGNTKWPKLHNLQKIQTFYMPLWELKELKLFGNILKKNPREIESAFQKFGGTARTVLGKDLKEGLKELEAVLVSNTNNNNNFSALLSVDSMNPDISGRIMHMKPKNNFEGYEPRVASEYIRVRMLHQAVELGRVQISLFLKTTSPYAALGGINGVIAENLWHSILCRAHEYRGFTQRKIDKEPKNPPGKKSRPRIEESSQNAKKDEMPFQFPRMNTLHSFMHNNMDDLIHLNCYEYVRPSTGNFSALDAFFVLPLKEMKERLGELKGLDQLGLGEIPMRETDESLITPGVKENSNKKQSKAIETSASLGDVKDSQLRTFSMSSLKKASASVLKAFGAPAGLGGAKDSQSRKSGVNVHSEEEKDGTGVPQRVATKASASLENAKVPQLGTFSDIDMHSEEEKDDDIQSGALKNDMKSGDALVTFDELEIKIKNFNNRASGPKTPPSSVIDEIPEVPLFTSPNIEEYCIVGVQMTKIGETAEGSVRPVHSLKSKGLIDLVTKVKYLLLNNQMVSGEERKGREIHSEEESSAEGLDEKPKHRRASSTQEGKQNKFPHLIVFFVTTSYRASLFKNQSIINEKKEPLQNFPPEISGMEQYVLGMPDPLINSARETVNENEEILIHVGLDSKPIPIPVSDPPIFESMSIREKISRTFSSK